MSAKLGQKEEEVCLFFGWAETHHVTPHASDSRMSGVAGSVIVAGSFFFYRSSIHQFIFDRRSSCTQGLRLVVRSNPGKVVLSIIFSLKSIWIKQLETKFMTGQKKIITYITSTVKMPACHPKNSLLVWEGSEILVFSRGVNGAEKHRAMNVLFFCVFVFFFFFLYQEPQTLTAESFSVAAVLNQLSSDLMFFPCKWTSSSQLKHLLSLRCFSCLTSKQLKEKVEKETRRESTLGRLANSRQDKLKFCRCKKHKGWLNPPLSVSAFHGFQPPGLKRVPTPGELCSRSFSCCVVWLGADLCSQVTDEAFPGPSRVAASAHQGLMVRFGFVEANEWHECSASTPLLSVSCVSSGNKLAVHGVQQGACGFDSQPWISLLGVCVLPTSTPGSTPAPECCSNEVWR